MKAIAGLLAQFVNLPGIVGAFLAGLAVNASVRSKPGKDKREFLANSFFIPIFFAVTGFLINPVQFVSSVVSNLSLALAIVGALLLGKLIAAETAGRVFGYSPIDRLTIWSLTLPQMAVTLAAALVAFTTFNRHGQRLVDRSTLNVVFVLTLTTSILGPVLTARFAPQMVERQDLENVRPPNSEDGNR